MLGYKGTKAFKWVERLSDLHRLLQYPGAGNFGTVKLAKHLKAGVTCAVKVIKKSGNAIYEQLY